MLTSLRTEQRAILNPPGLYTLSIQRLPHGSFIEFRKSDIEFISTVSTFQPVMSRFSSVIALGSDDTPITPGNQLLPEHHPPPSSGLSGTGEVLRLVASRFSYKCAYSSAGRASVFGSRVKYHVP